MEFHCGSVDRDSEDWRFYLVVGILFRGVGHLLHGDIAIVYHI